MTGGADQASFLRTQVSVAGGTGEHSENREVEDRLHRHGCSECFPFVPFSQTLFLLDRGVGMVVIVVPRLWAVSEGLLDVLVGAGARKL